MSIDPRRRSLLLFAGFGALGLNPVARASVHFTPAPVEEGPVDLIRRFFEWLETPEQRAMQAAHDAALGARARLRKQLDDLAGVAEVG